MGSLPVNPEFQVYLDYITRKQFAFKRMQKKRKMVKIQTNNLTDCHKKGYVLSIGKKETY